MFPFKLNSVTYNYCTTATNQPDDTKPGVPQRLMSLETMLVVKEIGDIVNQNANVS